MGNSLVFWQNIPSIHQAPLIREIARQWPEPVFLVAEKDLPKERREQGWSRPNFGSAELVVAPERAARKALVRETGPGSIHIFSGLHAYPETYWTLRQVARTPACMGVFVEPIDVRGLKGSLKNWAYRSHALRWGHRLDFMLVTGERGRRWYAKRGFSEQKLYPFGYFVTTPEADSAVFERKGLQMLFVGQLVPRKGVDLLLDSLSRLRERTWNLRLVGQGRDSTEYVHLGQKLGLSERIEWLGTVPNHQVRWLMRSADCLVLPSRFDGWGAVVNEALMVGTPVIMSDACGAADLVSEAWRGRVFPAGSIPALADALQGQLALGPVTVAQRERIQAWTMRSIAPPVVARYLLDVIRHARNEGGRPLAPWLISSVDT